MLHDHSHLVLPDWIHAVADTTRVYATDADKMQLAITLSGRNVALGTGGPFGAAVFDGQDRLIAVGVNRVVPQACSVAHAEMMAYLTAQASTGRARLNETGERIVLATSAQPCCMCYGATFWAGIDVLLIGARASDVMALTEFDEGPLPADWVGELETRGIAVRGDILRDAACDVLRAYASGGGINY